MPVEIRELQIITTVQDSGSKPSSGTSGSQGSSDDIVAKCVEQVLAVLKEKTER
jgi:hypothetical protein